MHGGFQNFVCIAGVFGSDQKFDASHPQMGTHAAAVVALDYRFDSGGFERSLGNFSIEVVDVGSYGNKIAVGHRDYLGGYSLAELPGCCYLF
jgi:hypothetical protein